MSISTLTSHIDSIVVYRQGALVTRVADLPGGEPVPPRVKLANLPLGLSDGSVRVRLQPAEGPAEEEDAAELPVASDVRVSLDVPEMDESLPPPDDEELEAARRRVQELSERILHLEERRSRLEQLPLVNRPEGKRGTPPPPSPVEARLALLDFRHATTAALTEELLATHAEARRAADIKEDLEHRHRSASRARQARSHELRKAAVVSLRARDVPAAPLRVMVEYMVPGARWAPSYAVKLSRDMRRATVAVRAVVAQDTGEDWRGVRLALATADAQRWTDLPELRSWRIGRRQPPPRRLGWRPPPAGAAELYGDYDRFTAANPAPSHAPSSTRSTRGRPPAPAARPEPAPAMAAPLAAEGQQAGGAFAEESTPAWSEQEAGEALLDMDTRGADAAYGAEPKALAKKTRSKTAGAPPPPAAPAPAMARPGPAQRTRSLAKTVRREAAGGGPPAGARGGPPGAPPVILGSAESLDAPRGAPAEPGALEVAPERLAYGDLRMPAPDDPRRGRLVMARRRERYLELLQVREVEIDVVTVVDQAVRRAHAVGAQPLPPGHRPVNGWDGFDFVYEADGTVDIPSDGRYHGIPLTSREAEATLAHVVVPRESTDVFRRLSLQNPLQAPLLPGPADVYVEGDYLMTTHLPATPARGTLDLGMGVDQAIKVSRNTHYAEESAGLMGGSLTLRHEIAIEVANHRDRTVQVEVQERVPVTRENEDEIQVSVGPVEPAWSPFEPEDYRLQGGYRWQLEVPAGQKQALRAVYVVKISAKKELVGGNRREA